VDSQRWTQIEELFHRVYECDPTQRGRLLEEACNGDSELRDAVEVLLAGGEGAANDLQAAVHSGLDAVAFPLVGETISHYRILGGIDTGGMGSVYRAEDIKLGRQVALKFLAEEYARDPEALSRFEREARAASALQHPNICTIYEFGEHAGQPFLVMHLLEGQTIRDLISLRRQQRPPFAIHELLNFALQIAGALDVAHRHGIIHRDIKPANLFITKQGEGKILDFGLAKPSHMEITEAASEPTADGSNKGPMQSLLRRIPTREAFLSRIGAAIGTAAYMSPEQARGERLDARTDIFSFGLVLYEMATGHRAFQRATEPVLHDVIVRHSFVPVRKLNPTLPVRFGAIVHKALERNRDSRYQTAAELCADLEKVERELEGRKASRLWAFSSLVLLAALVAGGAVTWFAKRGPSLHAGADIRYRRLTGNSADNPVTSGAISPSGKYLAYVDSRGVHVKDIDTGDTRTLAPPQDIGKEVTWEIIGPAWFPDSARFVANAHPAGGFDRAWSSQTTSIWIFSRANATPQKLREHAVAWSVSPDGSLISFGTNRGSVGERESWQMSATGQQAHKIFETGENSSIHGFFWSPGGRRGLYVKTDASGDTLLTRDGNGESPVMLPIAGTFSERSPDALPSDLSWLPDGRVLYPGSDPSPGSGGACNFWARRLDPATGEPLGTPERLTNLAESCYVKANATADGKRLAFLRTFEVHATAAVMDLDARGTPIGTPRHITLENDETVGDWTGDSHTLIVGVNRSDSCGVYAQPLSSGSRQALAPFIAGAQLADVGMSPDGRWVLAGLWPLERGPSAGNPDAPLLLVRIPITGGAPQTILQMIRSGPFSCTRWPADVCVLVEQTADARQVVVTEFDAIRGRGHELARVSLARKPDFWDNPLAAISPEGTRLVVARSPDGPIEVRSLRGEATFTVDTNGLDKLWVLAWAPDGHSLIVHRHVQGGAEVLRVDLHGEVTRLWKTNSPRGAAIPSPDGRHLAIIDWDQDSNMWMMENF
jgi:serine/threonine protein kinase/Tol biopolymer transport system component